MSKPDCQANQTACHQNRWHTILVALLCALMLNLPIDRTSLSNLPDAAESAVAELLPPIAQAAPTLQTDAPLLTDIEAIAAGEFHTCALTTKGSVKCWGNNGRGQLGNGSTSNSNTPVDVSGLASGVIAITANGYHTCAVIRAPNGTKGVKCWGGNEFGQLGSDISGDVPIPVNVAGLSSGVIAVAAGSFHTCALTIASYGNRGVKCWGRNHLGQLGNGSTSNSTTPVNVSGLSSGITTIAAGGSHTCAVVSAANGNRIVKCWGSNTLGQLGNGSNTNSTTPVDVSGLPAGTTRITASDGHTCVQTNIGGVKCWGWNASGQLGNGTTTNSTTPVNVSGISSGATAIAANVRHTCAIISRSYGNKSVKCWGNNSDGQLGNGSNTNSNVPVDVTGLPSRITAVTGGSEHTCALTRDLNGNSGVKCWGNNSDGQLGNGSNINSNTPVDVLAGPNGEVPCGSLHQEAEGGTLVGDFEIDSDAGASNGRYVHVPEDSIGDEWDGPNPNRRVDYCFSVAKDGNYAIKGMVYGTDGESDSFYVKVNDAPANGYLWAASPHVYDEWVLDFVNDRNTGRDPLIFPLTAGEHTVSIFVREDGTRLDTIELEEVNTSSTCGALHQEAENGTRFGDFEMGRDPGASNGRYILVPEDSVGDEWEVPNPDRRVDFCFTVPEDGNYAISAMVLSTDHQSDSFYVKMNDAPANGHLWAVSPDLYNTWTLDFANNRTTGIDTLIFPLKAGEHTVSIFLREDGTQLDTISLVPVEKTDDILGDVSCDNDISAVDSLFILQFTIGMRADGGGCADSANESLRVNASNAANEEILHARAGDVNADGIITAVDALFILQCEVGISNAFCPGVQAAAVMSVEEAAVAEEVKQVLTERGLWYPQNISVFVPLVTR